MGSGFQQGLSDTAGALEYFIDPSRAISRRQQSQDLEQQQAQQAQFNQQLSSITGQPMETFEGLGPNLSSQLARMSLSQQNKQATAVKSEERRVKRAQVAKQKDVASGLRTGASQLKKSIQPAAQKAINVRDAFLSLYSPDSFEFNEDSSAKVANAAKTSKAATQVAMDAFKGAVDRFVSVNGRQPSAGDLQIILSGGGFATPEQQSGQVAVADRQLETSKLLDAVSKRKSKLVGENLAAAEFLALNPGHASANQIAAKILNESK